VRVDADGRTHVTYAKRRDEATYRTAVDRTVDLPSADAGGRTIVDEPAHG